MRQCVPGSAELCRDASRVHLGAGAARSYKARPIIWNGGAEALALARTVGVAIWNPDWLCLPFRLMIWGICPPMAQQPLEQLSLEDFRKLIPVNGLREENLLQLHKRIDAQRAKAGTRLFEIGSSKSDSIYVLRGDVALCDESGNIVRSIHGGSADALHRLAHQVPRRVNAICRSEVDYIAIDSGLLDVMLTWDQTGSFEVDELQHEDDEDTGDWMTRLLQMKAFQKVPPSNLQAMFMRMEQVQAKAGEVVIRQGEEGDFFYVLIAGRALVTRETPTSPKPIRLAELDASSCFGEEALISDDVRNATVTMLEKGTLMRLAKDDFRALLTAPLTSDISFPAASEKVATGEAIWLDVRLPSEYKNHHLDGALNIPLFMLRLKLASLDKSKTYIVYCDGGRRSAVGSFVLTHKGFEAKRLKGGMPEQPAEV